MQNVNNIVVEQDTNFGTTYADIYYKGDRTAKVGVTYRPGNKAKISWYSESNSGIEEAQNLMVLLAQGIHIAAKLEAQA